MGIAWKPRLARFLGVETGIITLMEEILNSVKQASNIVIVPSFRLDADCLGSALGLMGVLKTTGKKTTVVHSGNNPGRYGFLPGANEIVFQDLFEFDFSPFDLAIFLDGPSLTQFYDFDKHRGEELKLPLTLKTISIDHHEVDKDFAQVSFADPTASSTAELVYQIFVNGAQISKEIATCLFVGISGDTGHFRHKTATPRALRFVANLLEAGVEINDIYNRLFSTQNYEAVKFAGHLITKIKVEPKYRFAYYVFSTEDWQNAKISLEMAAEASEIARDKIMLTIDGIDFCFVLKEEQKGQVKGSLRTRVANVVDLNTLAKIISPEKGGGHKESAGFTLVGKSLEEAEKYVQEVIIANYDKIKI